MPMPPVKLKSQRHYVFTVKRNGAIVKTHTLLLNPEDMSQDEPARTDVFKTLGGAYAEEWGRDIMTYSIRGTTGYRIQRNAQGRNQSGAEAFKALRDDIYRYYLEPNGVPKQVSTDKSIYTLEFNNFDDGEHYVVVPQRFSLKRSKNQPLLYAYDFTFYCLYPIGKKPTAAAPKPAGTVTFSQMKTAIIGAANLIRILLN